MESCRTSPKSILSRAPSACFDSLPFHLLRHILGLIALRPRILIVSRVCHSWRRAVLTSVSRFPATHSFHAPLSNLLPLIAFRETLEELPTISPNVENIAAFWIGLSRFRRLTYISISDKLNSPEAVETMTSFLAALSVPLHLNVTVPFIAEHGAALMGCTALTELTVREERSVSRTPVPAHVSMPHTVTILTLYTSFPSLLASLASQLTSLCLLVFRRTSYYDSCRHLCFPRLEYLHATMPDLCCDDNIKSRFPSLRGVEINEWNEQDTDFDGMERLLRRVGMGFAERSTIGPGRLMQLTALTVLQTPELPVGTQLLPLVHLHTLVIPMPLVDSVVSFPRSLTALQLCVNRDAYRFPFPVINAITLPNLSHLGVYDYTKLPELLEQWPFTKVRHLSYTHSGFIIPYSPHRDPIVTKHLPSLLKVGLERVTICRPSGQYTPPVTAHLTELQKSTPWMRVYFIETETTWLYNHAQCGT